MAVSLDQFTRHLVASGLMSSDDVSAALASVRAEELPQDAEQLARLLIQQRKLTPFQARQIYAGKGESLVLGNYVVLDKLGQGGMGMVLKAEHRRMKRVVALKVLSPAVTQTPEMTRRFQREVEAAAKLEHPNIVTAHDADEANGRHFLVMQFVEGTDLAALVATQGKLPVEKGVACVLQAARGLEYAHRRGVVHRDIKPANLLLDREGTVKILDMGLARLDSAGGDQDQLTGTGQIMGTVDFMAPEQAMDTRTADNRADIYALGMTLWYLLTGRAVYEGDTVVKKLMAHQNKPIPSLRGVCPQVSAELDAVFAKMVAKSPEARQQSMSEVIADLERCLAGCSGSVSAPAMAPGPGDDSHLGEFLRGIDSSLAPTLASRIGAAQESATLPEVQPTLIMRSGQVDTDPQTQQSLTSPQTAQSLRRRRTDRWRGGRAIWIAAVCGGLALCAAIVFRGPEKSEGIKAEADAAKKQPGQSTQRAGWHGWPANAPLAAIAPFDARQAAQHQADWAAYLQVPVEHSNSLGMRFRLIPPGEFQMGNTPAEVTSALAAMTETMVLGDETPRQDCIRSEAPRHKVILTQPLYVGTHEVTQQDYQAVMGKNPSHFATTGIWSAAVAGLDTASHPVETLSWNDAAEFCAKLSRQEQLKPFYFRAGETITPLSGTGYRLLTEAEWEFACRAGTATRFWIGDRDEDLVQAGWFGKNSGGRTHSVGELKGNPFGLYDVHGNVWEWVQDGWDPTAYGQFTGKPAIDPCSSFSASAQRMLRGGHWYPDASYCRSAHRHARAASGFNGDLGFRLALTVDAVKKSTQLSRTPGGPITAPKSQSAGEWLELIPLIDPAQDKYDLPNLTGANEWQVRDGELRFVPDGKPGKLLFPVRLLGRFYEFEMEVTRLSGNAPINTDIPARTGRVPVVWPSSEQGTLLLGTSLAGRSLQVGPNQRIRLLVRVTASGNQDRIEIVANDVSLLDWVGDRESLARKLNEGYAESERTGVFINPHSTLVYHRLRLRMLDGTLERIRPRR